MAELSRLLSGAEVCFAMDRAKSRYDVSNDVRFDIGTVLSGEGEIVIGGNTYLGERCHIVSHPQGNKIVIGSGCAISHNVHLRTHGYRTDIHFSEAREDGGISQDIQIGDDVWIGANVFVVGGVTIGSNSVIGANSVVTKDVPENCIVAGVPARLIRMKSSVAGSC